MLPDGTVTVTPLFTVIGPGKNALLLLPIDQSADIAAGHSNPWACTSLVTVWLPVTAKVVPSNVRLASPSSSVVVEPIVVNLLAAWLFNAVIVPATVAHVRPPVLPDCFCRNCPLDPALLIFKLSSSTISLAITVAPSAVDVTSPLSVSYTHLTLPTIYSV